MHAFRHLGAQLSYYLLHLSNNNKRNKQIHEYKDANMHVLKYTNTKTQIHKYRRGIMHALRHLGAQLSSYLRHLSNNNNRNKQIHKYKDAKTHILKYTNTGEGLCTPSVTASPVVSLGTQLSSY